MANNSDLYAQMGIAALLPGMTRALELLQTEVDSMRAMLTNAQAGVPIIKKRGRKPGWNKKQANGSVPVPSDKPAKARGYWAKMTPEQRKKEMKRRQRVAAGKARPRTAAARLAKMKLAAEARVQ